MLTTLTPLIAIHAAAALAATAVGPVALWARMGSVKRPRMHRASGYTWVTLMLVTALSACFISAQIGPFLAGLGPIHLLIPFTVFMLVRSFVYLHRRDIAAHKAVMQKLYIGSCLVAGAFTLLPGRLLGHWLWTSLGVLPA